MILIRYIRDFFYFVPIAFLGWVKVLKKFLGYLYFSWKKYPILIRIATIVFLAQLVFSTRPWFEYKIRFYEADENLLVSSKINLIFIFLSLVNFILLLTEVSFSKVLILTLQVIMGALFLVGFQSPTSLHIDFTNPNDYRFSLNFYLFFGFHALAVALSVRNFLNKTI